MKRVAVLYAGTQSNLHVINEMKDAGFTLLLIEERQSLISHINLVLSRRRDAPVDKASRLAFLACFYGLLKIRVEPKLRKVLNLRAFRPDRIASEINDAAVVRSVIDFQPEVVVTLGTSMLSNVWLEQHVRLFNLHVGVLPEYRGRFCWLWPIFEKRFHQWGVTVHSVSKHADAGVAHITLSEDPRKTTDLSIAALLARISTLGATAMLRALALEPAEDRSENMRGKHYFEPKISDFFASREEQ